MNYLELINRFWLAHEGNLFSCTETALYFYLLKTCNLCGWPDSIKRNNAKIQADLGITYPTLSKARNRLKQTGMIDFKTKAGSCNTSYTFKNILKVSLKDCNEVTTEVSSEVGDEVGSEVDFDTSYKGDKDKRLKIKQKPPVSPPKSEDAELSFGTSGNGDSGSTVNSEKTNIASKPDIDKSADSPMASKHTIPENRTEAAGISNEIPDAVNLSPEGEIGKNKAQKTDVRFFAEVVKFYNDTCQSLRPVKILTDKRRAAVSARLREHGREAVFNVIRAAGRSSFLAGQNTRGWTADFDWIFRPENFVKVLEGKYENKEKSQQYGSESNRQINERLAVPSHYEVF